MEEILSSEKEDLAKSFPASLSIYPAAMKGGVDEKLTRIIFFLAFAGIGVFSVTRLFLIHWVWLIPVALGSLTLLAITIIVMKGREKPRLRVRVGREDLCLDTVGESEEPTSRCYPIRDVSAKRLSGEGNPPERFSLMFEGREICECNLFGVRNVSLYQTIFEYFRIPK
jgi:hypothetical protein